MRFARSLMAFLLSVAATYVAAASFYTQQVIAKQAQVGAQYTIAQQSMAYRENFLGLLGAYLPILAIALATGFVVAAIAKTFLKPLAPLAYPIAGFCSVVAAIYLIENVMLGGGVGVIGGARDVVGLSLQGLAGGIGGLVFSLSSARKKPS